MKWTLWWVAGKVAGFCYYVGMGLLVGALLVALVLGLIKVIALGGWEGLLTGAAMIGVTLLLLALLITLVKDGLR